MMNAACNSNKKGGLFSRPKLRGKDLNLRPLGYEPLFLMGVLVISTISVSSISVYFGLFWCVGPRFAPALAPAGQSTMNGETRIERSQFLFRLDGSCQSHGSIGCQLPKLDVAGSIPVSRFIFNNLERSLHGSYPVKRNLNSPGPIREHSRCVNKTIAGFFTTTPSAWPSFEQLLRSHRR